MGGRQPSHQTRPHLARPTTRRRRRRSTNTTREQRETAEEDRHSSSPWGKHVGLGPSDFSAGEEKMVLDERVIRREMKPLMANRQRCRRHKASDLSLSTLPAPKLNLSHSSASQWRKKVEVSLYQRWHGSWMRWGIDADRCLNVMLLLPLS
jgi:hypothetical protein